jgi:hypothetical protein
MTLTQLEVSDNESDFYKQYKEQKTKGTLQYCVAVKEEKIT